MNQSIISKLGAAFPFEAVEAKIQVTTADKAKGMAVFYLDSRAIQNRLDDVVGALNWSNHYSVWHDKAQICGISIYNAERDEWVTKHDGAENSDIEAIKGGLTDAFKRAAVLWGIGRYLYQIDGVWVEIEPRGKGHFIKNNQQPILKAAYENAVKKIFGSAANQQAAAGNAGAGTAKPQPRPANTPPPQSPPAPPIPPSAASNAPPASAPQAANNKSAPPAPQAPGEQKPAAAAPQTANNKQASPTPQTSGEQKPATAPPASDFKIHSIKPAGKTSQLLELCNAGGEILAAYIKSDVQGIAVGTRLRNVQLEEKSNSFKKFNVVTSYEIAA